MYCNLLKNLNTFDKDICWIFKYFKNESDSRTYEKILQNKEIALMTEENKNLEIEVEILKDFKKDYHSERTEDSVSPSSSNFTDIDFDDI